MHLLKKMRRQDQAGKRQDVLPSGDEIQSENAFLEMVGAPGKGIIGFNHHRTKEIHAQRQPTTQERNSFIGSVSRPFQNWL